VGLVLIMGIAAGAVINAAAGARRTDSAYPRFLQTSRAADALFYDARADPGLASFSREQIESIPQVAETASIVGYATTESNVDVLGPGDDRYGTTVGRQKILSGRRPVRSNEVMLGFLLAEQRNLHVGDHLTVSLLPKQASPDAEAPPPRPFTFTVVGIEAAPGEFPPQTGSGFHTALLSRAFIQEHDGELQELHATAARLKGGSNDVPALRRALDRMSGGRPTTAFLFRDQAVNTQRSIHLQAVALWLLAALLGLTGALILSQLFLRQSLLEANEHPALRALGMERGQLFAIGMARALIIGMAAAVVSVITAIVLSPLTPVGIARLAEPNPGVAVDALTLTVGAFATVLLALAVAAWPAWRASRAPTRADEARSTRSSAVGDALARTSTPPPVAAGVRLALDPGRGRSAVPIRSTVLGAALGIGALAGALVFNGSLAHLLSSPQLYGVAWDARVTVTSGGQVRGASVENLASAVQDDPDVADLSIGYVGVPLQVRDTRVDAVILQPLRGTFQPRVLEGELPLGPDEILLGTRTLSEIGASVGDQVSVTLLGVPQSAPLRVVGRGMLPSTSDAMGLGKGASMSLQAAEHLLSPSGGTATNRPAFDNLIVRFKPDVSASAARKRLQEIIPNGSDYVVVAPDKPTDVVNFGRVQNLPLVLAGLLAALAAATLTHLLVTSIRRRGRELAILKTMGFVPRQVRTAVAWQATTLAVVAMALGLPLGIAAGRWAWILFAHQLGIIPVPIVPILVVLLLVPGTLVVANLVAVVPASLAAHLRPAKALRAE